MIKLAYLAIVFCWSTSWLAVSINANLFNYIEFSIFYRKIIACVICFVVAFVTKERLRLTKKELLFALLMGFLTIFIAYMATYYVSRILLSGFICAIGATGILLAEIISSMVHKHRISVKKILIGLIGVCGVVLLMHKDISINLTWREILGIGIALIVPLCNVIGSTVIEKYHDIYQKIPKMTFMGVMYLFASILFGIVGLIKTNGQWIWMPMNFQYVASLLYLSIFASFIAFWALFYLSSKLGSTKASYYTIINPPIAMLITSQFESFDWDIISIIGIFVLVASAYIGLKQKSSRA